MTDLLDERLAAAAHRWRSEQPPPPRIPVEALDRPLPRRAGWRAAVVAAAALALVGAGTAAFLRATGGDHAGPSHSPGSSSPRVRVQGPLVPWRPLPAGHPRLVHRVQGKPVTKYDAVIAGGEISGHVHPGETLTFTAYLESLHTLTLDPCPDYTISFGANDAHTWRLNCGQDYWAQGSLARPHGRTDHSRLRHAVPVLPGGHPVRFEMKVRVPEVTGAQKVLWTLDGPHEEPGFYGIVHVDAG